MSKKKQNKRRTRGDTKAASKELTFPDNESVVSQVSEQEDSSQEYGLFSDEEVDDQPNQEENEAFQQSDAEQVKDDSSKEKTSDSQVNLASDGTKPSTSQVKQVAKQNMKAINKQPAASWKKTANHDPKH